MKIPIEISAHHCHLSKNDLEKLFGKGYKLKALKPISQPGQFAARETVGLKTKGGLIESVRILGPARRATQIELTQTDCHKLKIRPPIRMAGDLKNSAGGKIIGPKGTVKIKKGIIIAKRHIHADPKTAKRLGLKNGQRVSVKTEGSRSVIFNNVIVKIREDFAFAFHIDTDEANAAFDFSTLSPAKWRGRLLRPF